MPQRLQMLPFNSIERIHNENIESDNVDPQPIFQFHWTDSNSLFYHFSTSKPPCGSFNSIERIHEKVNEVIKQVKKATFNSIERILAHVKPPSKPLLLSFLSIPLNGFQAILGRWKEDADNHPFQFHWTDSLLIILGFLTFLASSFQFHWTDSLRRNGACSRTFIYATFNSIERIPFLFFFSILTGIDLLSIPLNGF